MVRADSVLNMMMSFGPDGLPIAPMSAAPGGRA
jgi:hypothetical protein